MPSSAQYKTPFFVSANKHAVCQLLTRSHPASDRPPSGIGFAPLLRTPCVVIGIHVRFSRHVYILLDCLQDISPILLSPFSEPKLSAKPCDRLRIRMKPVTGPLSPSFSTLKFARASSPMHSQYMCKSSCWATKLTKHAPGVEIGTQELAVAFQACVRSEAAHVRHLH